MRWSRHSSSGPRQACRAIPGAWLMAAAKHRAIDHLRRDKLLERKHEELGYELEARAGCGRAGSRRGPGRRGRRRPSAAGVHGVPSGALDRGACRAHAAPARRPDDRRDRARLPRLRGDNRAAHRPSEANAGRRRVPFEVPRGAELAARLSSVLEVIYLVFNEGYSATAGDDWMRPGLCEDALRLGRILAELVPQEAEVHGLVALDGDSGVAVQGAGRPRRASRSCCSIRTAPVGISFSSAAASRPSHAPRRSAARAARTRSRRRSPPVTHERVHPRTPTGVVSRRCTNCLPDSRRLRSWS